MKAFLKGRVSLRCHIILYIDFTHIILLSELRYFQNKLFYVIRFWYSLQTGNPKQLVRKSETKSAFSVAEAKETLTLQLPTLESKHGRPFISSKSKRFSGHCWELWSVCTKLLYSFGSSALFVGGKSCAAKLGLHGRGQTSITFKCEGEFWEGKAAIARKNIEKHCTTTQKSATTLRRIVHCSIRDLKSAYTQTRIALNRVTFHPCMHGDYRFIDT